MNHKAATLPIIPLKSVLFSTAFVAANTLLPQLFHLFNLGGNIWLPILVFTLVTTIVFGSKAGIAVGVLSPIASMLLFDMPSTPMCLILVAKGATMAGVLGALGQQYRLSLHHILIAIAAYQLIGAVVATVLVDFSSALYAIEISWPGMMLQLAVGVLVLRLTKKQNA